MGPSFIDDKKHPNVDARLAKSHVTSPLSSNSASDFFNTESGKERGKNGMAGDSSDPTSLHAYLYHEHQFEALLQEEMDHYVVLEGGGGIDASAGEVTGVSEESVSGDDANMVFSSDLMYAALHPDCEEDKGQVEATDEPKTPNSLEGISLHGVGN